MKLSRLNQKICSLEHRMYDFINVFHSNTTKPYSSPIFSPDVKANLFRKSKKRLNDVLSSFLKIYLHKPGKCFSVFMKILKNAAAKLHEKSVNHTEFEIGKNTSSFVAHSSGFSGGFGRKFLFSPVFWGQTKGHCNSNGF